MMEGEGRASESEGERGERKLRGERVERENQGVKERERIRLFSAFKLN